MKNPILFYFLLLFAQQVNSQDNLSLFSEYLQIGDTVKQFELLKTWEHDFPKDAELYTCFFNYYFNKSRNEILMLNSGNPPEGEKVLVLTDSSDQIAGYIGSQINYDQSNLKLAFEYIDKGINLYPDRLDMRFGKIHAIGQIADWNSFTNEIIKTINYSALNKNNWTWTYNQKIEDGEEMFLTSLQDYQAQLYNTMDDKLLVKMQEISRAILIYYPNHIASLSNLSIAYLVKGDYEKALIPLLKAEQINPSDIVVLFNIAYAYREDGNKGEAIKYYEKVLKYGDEQAKNQAEEQIRLLKE